MQDNLDKITKEFCQKNLKDGKTLVFQPKDAGDVAVITQHLHSLGYQFSPSLLSLPNDLRTRRLQMLGIRLYTSTVQGRGRIDILPPTPKRTIDVLRNGVVCTAEQCDPNYVSPAEQARQTLENGALAEMDRLIGLADAKRDIHQHISVQRRDKLRDKYNMSTKSGAKHMVFSGNPGTGKTTFARLYARFLFEAGLIEKPDIVEVTREDLVGQYIGDTAPLVREVVDSALGGVLFIDEAYTLTNDHSADRKDFGHEAVATLLKEMENNRDNLIVIAAGYPDLMKEFVQFNPGLKSRFTTYINFPDYSVQELGDILSSMLQENGLTMDDNSFDAAMQLLEKDKIASKTDFGNARTVRTLVEQLSTLQAERLDSEGFLDDDGSLDDEQIKQALSEIKLEDVAKADLSGVKTNDNRFPIGFAAEPLPQARPQQQARQAIPMPA